MSLILDLRNESQVKRAYRADVLRRLAEHILQDEGLTDTVEVGVLFCDDAFIARLNRNYRHKSGPTDVLSFSQSGGGKHAKGRAPAPLGDIVISLETVARRCGLPAAPDRLACIRAEVRLLFCHGLLHLLGYTHEAAQARARMAAKQAHYLGMEPADAWPASAPIP